VSGRADHRLIAAAVGEGARVLDVGCGDGALLERLKREKSVRGVGLELSPRNVAAAMAKGLSVVQGDADSDLADYPDAAFDHVVLSHSIQAMRAPLNVLKEALRIGRSAIVSFPNFGHWRVRLSIGLRGRMPTTPELPHAWHDTPNIHLCSIADFVDLCEAADAEIVAAHAFNGADANRSWSFSARGPGAAWASAAAASALFVARPRRAP